MHNVCGVDIAANEATIVLLVGDSEKYDVIQGAFNKITLDDSSQDQYKSFLDTLLQFIKQYDVEKIFYKKPPSKGQQIAGPCAFRIETLLQLLSIPVISVHPATLAAFLKKCNIEMIKYINVYKYQYTALNVAYYGLANF